MKRLLAVAGLIVLLSHSAWSQTQATLVLKNVNIVGLAGDADQTGRDVFINGEKIIAVRAAGSRPHGEAKVLDGTGRWLIPGLIDMRVHLEFSEVDHAARQRDLAELLSYGITSVLDLSSAAAVVDQTEKKSAPRIFFSAAPMRSQPVQWSTTSNAFIKNEKEARLAVQAAKQKGAKFIYLDANLEAGAVKAAIQEAGTHGMLTAGAFLATSFEEAARNGVNVVYGMTSLLSGFADGGERKNFAASWSRAEEGLLLPKNSVQFFKAWQKVELQKNARKKLQVLANQAVFFVPTLALESNRLVEYAQTGERANAQKLQEKYRQLLRMAFDLQIPLLAGSGYNSQRNWRPTLPEELLAWVQAGIEPRFALEAATINAGHALRQTNLGQIGEGMLADLVLVDEHPFKNIATLQRPWAVITNGNVLSQKELAQLRDTKRVAERQIRAVLERQVRAWNDGDLERFMRGYWKNDSTIFASGGNVSKGWQEMLARYQRSYPTLEKMGQLEFNIYQVELLVEEWAKVLGQWKLVVGTTTPQGLFTLILRRLPEDWRVVHDHTSSATP